MWAPSLWGKTHTHSVGIFTGLLLLGLSGNYTATVFRVNVSLSFVFSSLTHFLQIHLYSRGGRGEPPRPIRSQELLPGSLQWAEGPPAPQDSQEVLGRSWEGSAGATPVLRDTPPSCSLSAFSSLT